MGKMRVYQLAKELQIENKDLLQVIKKLGFEGFMNPVSTSCVDHEGAHSGSVQAWDGKKWHVTAGPYESDLQIIKPIIRASAAKYAAEKKVPPRDCAKDASN